MKPLKQHVLRIKIILFLIVLPAVLKAQSNQTVNAGSQTVVVNFPVTTCTYNWTNNNTAIGLGASGTGDIATFTATNTTGNPITATITATPAGPTPQPPLLYIPNFDANTVSVINATTNTLLTTVPVGTNPYGVMVSHDYNRVYIANQGSNDVSVIYMPTNRVLATIPGFSTPGAIAVSPDNQTIYVANSGSNTVAIIDALNNTIIATIPVGQSPIGLSLNFDGSKLYVANNNSLTVSVINIATKAVTNTIILNSNPDFTLLSPDGSKLYVVESFLNEIMVVNTTTNLVTTFVVPGNKPKGVAISPDGSRLYVANSADGNIAVINTTNNTIITTINTGATPTGLSISDDGSLLYVCNSGSNNVSVINTTTLLVTQTINVRARPFSVGNFYLTRADCGAPITFNITVNAAAPTPVITTNGTPSAVSTIFGTPSTPATFMAGASNATGNLVVSAPTGFEVSLDNSNYYNVVTMNGPGSITSRTAYIRLKSTTPMGTYSGNIVLTSPGATTVNVIMPLSTVTAPNPFITATGTPSSVNTAYGTPSSPTSFMVSGTGMSAGILATPPPGFEVSTDGVNFASTVTIGGIGAIASTKVYIRLKKTTAAGTYSGNIVLSSTGASDVNVAMQASTVNAAQINIYVYGSKVYGGTLNDFVATTSNFDFSIINAGLKNGETVSSLDISFTGGNTTIAPVGVYNNAILTSNITGANGFLLSNYIVTYQTGTLTVTPAMLTITANNVSKAFGNTLTGGAGSTAFTITGLQNLETISSLTLTYGNGAVANAAIGIYNGSVVPSAAVGGNGFLASNYTINYVPGNITVNAAGPSITASGTLQPLTTIYGTPSSSTSITVSGSALTSGIVITPPAGFEVSTDNLTFGNTVTVGSSGTVPPIPVYIRLKQTTFVGSYSGNISLKSPGAADVNQIMPVSTVTPAPLLITANSIVKIYGNTLTGAPGSTTFIVNGLKNAETVGAVTIVYGAAAGANANTGTYNVSVIPSAAAGGTFAPGNYTITYQAGNITVTPASLTATADSKSKIYGDVNPVLTISYTGFVNSDGIAQLTTQPAAVTTATQASPVGQYPIIVSDGSASNYTFGYVDGILTVNQVPSAIINIPNTFTPNGDGINDTWNINNLNTYSNVTVEILNRYGTRVYFSNNYSVPWDGKYNGANVPAGTYYYVITGVNNKPLTGYVAVIR